ncbi:carbohydrate ABC transporter permease [Actinomycetaceae bacterium MB13-C1-2]|nr:carbohydrate ABC transporter permease [Actinomycetaceae bacterium MB13-C1-2]
MSAVAITNPPSDTPSSSKAARRPRGARASLWSYVSVNGLLVIGSLYMLFPTLWLVFSSTKSLTALYTTPAFSFADMKLGENIQNVLSAENGIFLRWMGMSFLYAGVGALVGGMISVMAGYAFDKYDFKGKKYWLGIVMSGVLIPNTATVIPLYMLASKVGLSNTIWAVLIPVLCNPFGVYLARTFSQGYVPNETLEAARVDGAGTIKTFVKVALPMMVPGYVTIALFQFVGIWNNFMLPLIMLQNRDLVPVSLGMSFWQGYTKTTPAFTPMVITGSLLSIIPLLIAFIALQRFWKAGLTAGAVK